MLADEEARTQMIINSSKFFNMSEKFPGRRFIAWGVSQYRGLNYLNFLIIYPRTLIEVSSRKSTCPTISLFQVHHHISLQDFYERSGNNSFANKVDQVQNFWPTPSPNFRKSMLIVLAKNVTSSDLSSGMIETTTLEDNNNRSPVVDGFDA